MGCSLGGAGVDIRKLLRELEDVQIKSEDEGPLPHRTFFSFGEFFFL